MVVNAMKKFNRIGFWSKFSLLIAGGQLLLAIYQELQKKKASKTTGR
jgi:6-phosphogluconolactonase/glucosamine-6-phosphate isomerase/deaminase